jgi:hypothetical protein
MYTEILQAERFHAGTLSIYTPHHTEGSIQLHAGTLSIYTPHHTTPHRNTPNTLHSTQKAPYNSTQKHSIYTKHRRLQKNSKQEHSI